MPEILQDWLGNRLGVVLDLSPDKFGRTTKDGTLLAKLLFSYGVIPVHVRDSVVESKNYYDCYNNLVILKPWLSYLGVTYDESMLQGMARGEGSAAISIFYSAYLNLERTDRFHYLSAQKERRYTENSCQRMFKVDWVPESQVLTGSVEPTVEGTFSERRDMLEWHKANCQEVVEKIKKTKEKYQKSVVQKKKELGPLISKHPTSQPLDKKMLEAEETREKIKAFERKHPHQSPDLDYAELMELQKLAEMQPCVPVPNWTAAKNIVGCIRHRKKSDLYARNFHNKMEHLVLDEFWKEIIEKQDREFENSVCANLLKQSQYEKQIASKLAMIRNQKKVFAENRRKIECLKMTQREKDYDSLVQRKMEMRGEYWEDEEFERERMAELHRRIYDEKVRRRREMIRKEARTICEALVDIAIRVSEIRDLTLCQIPKTFMKDMKELFFKDLSIFDLLDNFEELYQTENDLNGTVAEEVEEEEEEGPFFRNDAYELLKCQERERQQILDECDFNDYIHLLGPWMTELLFPEGSESEVKHVVLGYIVHKLLEVKYPAPRAPVPAEIKPMKPVAVVQGLFDDTACSMFVDLMEACRILVVKVDDAINFVLAAYKEELSVVRDIDVSFQKATATALKDRGAKEKEVEVKKKVQLLKKESPEKMTLEEEEEFYFLDKETQTPRMIPEDDPLLSANAEVGKQAFEALGAGDPVPDSVIVTAIIGYVISKQDDYEGWLVLNYPLLYSQASDLECSLIGYRTLPILEEMDSLEEAEGFTYRGPWADPFSRDDFAENRISRLVPKLEPPAPPPEIPMTYFDLFVKLRKIGEGRGRSQDSWDITPLEKFYLDQGILVSFEYQALNFQAVKDLGKTILENAQSEDVSGLAPKTSLEIFGSIILELNEKWNPSKKKNGKEKESAPGSKRFGKGSLTLSSNPLTEEEKPPEDQRPSDSSPPKPGDPDWEWATGPQPESIQLGLASIWENMEAVYVEDFKTVFFCLRVHRCNVYSYSASVKTFMRTLIRRPDDQKQKVLGDFQQMFNDIDEDLRPDVDIKCELHVRVSELEEALMSITDERKADFQKDLKKISEDCWVADEMSTLVNAFLSALQLEADRCVDSCQVITDYYLTLQQRVPDEKGLAKVTVPKLKVKDRKYSIVSTVSNRIGSTSLFTPRNSESKKSSKSLLDQSSKVSKTRSWADKRRRSTDSGFLEGAAEVIKEILANLSLPEGGLTPFHNFFIDTVQMLTGEVKAMIEGCISEAKRGDKTMPRNPKKDSDTKTGNNGNLNLEWTTALENELSRFLFRTKLILARGIFDMNEFLTTILNIVSSLAEDIEEMYQKEIQSISECCKVFRCAIEEEIVIQPQLELFEDKFIVNDDVFLFASPPTKKVVPEDEHKSQFTVEQLSLLCHKFQRVAPNGEIIRRSMLYILEDLKMMKPEVEGFGVFPELWKGMEPEDLNKLMDEVYQDLEVVHWKDFVVYALELPPPTDQEILSMRTAFRKFDPCATELVTREDYDKVQFWFEVLVHYPAADKLERAKDLLYRMYQVNEHQTNYSALLLAFCKHQNPVQGFLKALTLVMGTIITLREDSDAAVSLPGETDPVFYDESDESWQSSVKKTFCCPSTYSGLKCIPKEKMVRCQCQDREREKSVTEGSEEEQPEDRSYSENPGESGSFMYAEYLSSSAIPSRILSSLLMASFPSLPQMSVLLDCKQTFQETLHSIYDSLDSRESRVETHRLVKHKFIDRLLHSTNKFKFVSIAQIVQWIVNYRSSLAASCVPDKLNFHLCLK